MCINSKATPTNDTDYSCQIKLQNLFNQSYRVHIMPVVIALGTDTNTNTYSHTLEIIPSLKQWHRTTVDLQIPASIWLLLPTQ